MAETELCAGDFVFVPPLEGNKPLLDDDWPLAQIIVVVPPYVKVKYRDRKQYIEACYRLDEVQRRVSE